MPCVSGGLRPEVHSKAAFAGRAPLHERGAGVTRVISYCSTMRVTEAKDPRWRARWIVALWAIQPVSIVVEVIVATFVTAPYSFVDNTISDLGAASCTTIAYPSAPVLVCSPAHAVMNGAFVVFGLTVAFGAVLLLMQRGSSRMLVLACWLWIISGISTAAVGVVPLDVDLELHALVSAPAILLQPIALALHAWVYAREDRRWFGLVIAACAIALVAVFFMRGTENFSYIGQRGCYFVFFVHRNVFGRVANQFGDGAFQVSYA